YSNRKNKMDDVDFFQNPNQFIQNEIENYKILSNNSIEKDETDSVFSTFIIQCILRHGDTAFISSILNITFTPSHKLQNGSTCFYASYMMQRHCILPAKKRMHRCSRSITEKWSRVSTRSRSHFNSKKLPKKSTCLQFCHSVVNLISIYEFECPPGMKNGRVIDAYTKITEAELKQYCAPEMVGGV
ncbi:Hypothetical predicted protein, partial [Mytilus galloprovincialis]